MSKATEAKARPGLKQLTPWEHALVNRMAADCRAMWRELFARNRWKPAPAKGKGQDKSSAQRQPKPSRL